MVSGKEPSLPQIVKKRQRRLGEVDEIVLSLYAKGLTTGEISAHFAEIYGASVSSRSDLTPIFSRIPNKEIVYVHETRSRYEARHLDEAFVIFHDMNASIGRHGARLGPKALCDVHLFALPDGHYPILVI